MKDTEAWGPDSPCGPVPFEEVQAAMRIDGWLDHTDCLTPESWAGILKRAEKRLGDALARAYAAEQARQSDAAEAAASQRELEAALASERARAASLAAELAEQRCKLGVAELAAEMWQAKAEREVGEAICPSCASVTKVTATADTDMGALRVTVRIEEAGSVRQMRCIVPQSDHAGEQARAVLSVFLGRPVS